MTKRPDATVRLLAAACVLSFSGVSFGQGACEVAKVIASNGQGGDRFGFAISIAATAAIVGMTPGGGGPDDEYAWIFQRDPDTGTWQEVAVLVDPDSQPGGGFGEAVAISGDFAIVGANNAGHDCPTNCTGPGAAYIFWRDQGGMPDNESPTHGKHEGKPGRPGKRCQDGGERAGHHPSPRIILAFGAVESPEACERQRKE